jgi:NAD(P)-dependent dehydrogenase (short-subunit alcohol dehydrogenase family)
MTVSSHRLAGRRIIVTGAASGIGRAVANLFDAEGAALALLDLNEAGLADTAKTCGGHVVPCDVGDEVSVKAAIGRAAEAMGGIDGLVNAAGYVNPQGSDAIDLAVWNRHMAVNVTGPMLLVREALPWLRRDAAHATIVTIASGQALRPGPGVSAYAASKAAVLNLSRVWAQELAPIRSNIVCPGYIDTPMIASAKQSPKGVPLDQYALGRLGDPIEVARCILFLTGGESSFVTGTAMAVDGGRLYH